MTAAVETGASAVKSGLNLAAARQEKGVTLEDIGQSTRIALHFLKSIEAEDFGALPGGVYNTSYLRQYARAIGYDESALLAHYRSQVEPQPAGPSDGENAYRLDEPLRNLLDFVTGRRSQHAA